MVGHWLRDYNLYRCQVVGIQSGGGRHVYNDLSAVRVVDDAILPSLGNSSSFVVCNGCRACAGVLALHLVNRSQRTCVRGVLQLHLLQLEQTYVKGEATETPAAPR